MNLSAFCDLVVIFAPAKQQRLVGSLSCPLRLYLYTHLPHQVKLSLVGDLVDLPVRLFDGG